MIGLGPFGWLVFVFVVAAIAVSARWFLLGPSKRTRLCIRHALETKGLTPISIRPKLQVRYGHSSKGTMIVTAVNPFGHSQQLYFNVDIWSDLFSPKPQVREVNEC